ncbi:MAG: glycosyltransferase [Rhodococcus sp. (in: high G+C Gram-positive bacteria)]|uniref:glycosyltransferase n=1 Tax=Rhodococcus sp. TaxID=1831 RepID=UPI003BAEC84E
MRIVQLANFYGPRSGGLRTALHHWGQGYAERGHEVVLVVPGRRDDEELLPSGVLRITRAAVTLPATGGYRVVNPRRVADVVRGLRPDVLEVSDRLTLRGFGGWARARGIRSVVVSHERLDRLIGQLAPGRLARDCADVANQRMARSYDAVVCTTDFASEEFIRIGVPNLHRVPLGVDLTMFHPEKRDQAMRNSFADPAQRFLLHCGRLSVEKQVERSIDAVRLLRKQGHDTRLVIAGDGPRRQALRHRARGLPVHFTGYISDKSRLAALFASADVSIAPGPHETFCLSALESLAAGTPVVASQSSALTEIITPECGALARDRGLAFADAISSVLAIPPDTRRSSARRRAENFGWGESVDGMLGVLKGS